MKIDGHQGNSPEKWTKRLTAKHLSDGEERPADPANDSPPSKSKVCASERNTEKKKINKSALWTLQIAAHVKIVEWGTTGTIKIESKDKGQRRGRSLLPPKIQKPVGVRESLIAGGGNSNIREITKGEQRENNTVTIPPQSGI